MKKAHFGPFLNGLHSASNRSMGMRLPRDPSSARAAGAGKGGWRRCRQRGVPTATQLPGDSWRQRSSALHSHQRSHRGTGNRNPLQPAPLMRSPVKSQPS